MLQGMYAEQRLGRFLLQPLLQPLRSIPPPASHRLSLAPTDAVKKIPAN